MLARFERLMEQAVEGSLHRVFPTSLQPVQLAKAAARAMEQATVIGLRGAEVPNSYRIRIAPVDLERFADYSATLSREVSRYLVEYASERGLRPVAEPRVELIGDERVRKGTVRADARFVDLPPERKAEVDAARDGTRRLRLADLAELSPPAAPPPPSDRALWLTDRSGLRVRLEPSAGIVRIGRAADNDVAIASQRVSRYHAQLRWIESNWLLYDLDSTNGTFVGDLRVLPRQPRMLQPGLVVRLGDHELEVGDGPPATTADDASVVSGD